MMLSWSFINFQACDEISHRNEIDKNIAEYNRSSQVKRSNICYYKRQCEKQSYYAWKANSFIAHEIVR